ncbi:GATA transcription factor 1-like [Telopea speciosissima]|uniref:GATA transcription factor 1-like n=1 Tax=Telopea speciosissima TaxID=54955 RepID=UPI001CC3E350|nr:GATA transcription factor 1-like [Telopea speciosissima]
MVSFAAGFLVEELLDFSSDIGEEDEEEDNKQSKSNTAMTTNNSCSKALSSSSALALDSKPTNSTTHQNYQPQHEAQTVLNIFDPDDDRHPSLPEFLEEELEWLTNEDAFPAVETFDDIFPGKLSKGTKNQSPVSVLENSSSSGNSGIMSCCDSLRVPMRARSKRRRRKSSGFSDIWGQQWWWWCEPKNKSVGGGGGAAAAANATIMATTKCLHCGTEKTPQWRAGPYGPKTLCNACGVRYKSGRLVPEYRPASSPSFSSKLHSNSHRKILEMRRLKEKEVLINSMDKG